MMDTKKIFRNKYLVILFAVIATLLWGSAFPSVKIGYELFEIAPGDTFGKILFAGYRFFLAGFLILLFALFTKQDLRYKPSQFKHILILGLLMTTIQYIFFYIGLSNTTGVKGAILNSTSVFFTFILAHFFLVNDRMSGSKVIGLILGFAGVILINYSPELLVFEFNPYGEGLFLISQLSGAIGGIYLKKVSQDISVIVLTSYQMMLGAVLLIVPATFAKGIWPFPVNSQVFLLMLYLALVSAIAFSLWNSLIKYNLVGKIAIYKFLIPVFGVLLSSLLLIEETITWITILALVVVCIGIIAVNRKNPEAEKEVNR